MVSREKTLDIVKKFGTPLYLYDEAEIVSQCQKLTKSFPGVTFHYALKANSNPALVRTVKNQRFGSEAVSLGELELAKSTGFPVSKQSFTCSNLHESELIAASKSGARIHLDSLIQLEVWGRNKLGRDVSLRINQGIGAGHHKHVITGGPDSKFGITLADIPKAKALADKYSLKIVGLQQHIGSNVLDSEIFLKAVEALLETASMFPDLSHIDFGGGIGIPYREGEKGMTLSVLGKRFTKLAREFSKVQGKEISIAMEPGRFIVATSGSLIVEVVDIKQTSKHTFVGVNSGFNQLIRPAMYGSYHAIESITRRVGKKVPITLAGNVCESGDVFAANRLMPLPHLGDILALRDAGAYGFSMASTYNLHALPKEVLVRVSGKCEDISFSPQTFAR